VTRSFKGLSELASISSRPLSLSLWENPTLLIEEFSSQRSNIMMLGAIRRRVASSGSAASFLGQSLQASRPVVSTSRVFSIVEKEVLLQPSGFGHARNFSHLVSAGCSVSLRPMRLVTPFKGIYFK
jgi:hypothetical protein